MYLQEGILYTEYATDAEIDIAEVKELVALRTKICKGKNYPCLSDIRGLRSVTAGARAYMGAEGLKNMSALAIVTGSAFSRAIAHLFLREDKPVGNMCFFGTVEAAKDWLEKFISV